MCIYIYIYTHIHVYTHIFRGKKIGFDKIIKMIDELVATLKTEQKNDEDY